MKVTILQIDDSNSDIELTQRAFRHVEDIQFIEAKDGELGLEVAIEALPDIILLDINLPKLRGDEVCRALKSLELTKKIPIVILTSNDDYEELERVYAVSANAYITKPVTLAKFREVASAVNLIWADPIRKRQ